MDSGKRKQERQFHGRRKSRPLGKVKRTILDEILPEVTISLPDSSAAGSIRPEQIFNGDVAGRMTDESSQYWLEIGFGGGEHMLEQAKNNPTVGYIGAEPFINGVAKAAAGIKNRNLKNVRLLVDDVRMLLRRLPDHSLDKVFILFPDPWPKKRHFKRRIIQKSLINNLHRVLKPGAELVIATDHADYLEWILNIFSDQAFFTRQTDDRQSIYQRPDFWISTKYEQKALAEGRKPAYLFFCS